MVHRVWDFQEQGRGLINCIESETTTFSYNLKIERERHELLVKYVFDMLLRQVELLTHTLFFRTESHLSESPVITKSCFSSDAPVGLQKHRIPLWSNSCSMPESILTYFDRKMLTLDNVAPVFGLYLVWSQSVFFRVLQ